MYLMTLRKRKCRQAYGGDTLSLVALLVQCPAHAQLP